MSATTIQALLDVLPIDRRCMTVPVIAKETGISRKEVSKGCIRLVSRKLVERMHVGCYRLTAAGLAAREAGKKLTSGPFGPLTGVRRSGDTFRARLWRALRTCDKATLPELLVLAKKDNEREAEGNARHYLNALEAAGYVRKMSRREPGTALTSNGFIKYFLIRDTGPKPPQMRISGKHVSDRHVLDLNTGEKFPLTHEVAP